MTRTNYDVIVIGEGVAGLACARHAARAGLTVATFESTLFGGLVLNVNELDGFPGQESGTQLASELMSACSESGVTSVQEEVTALQPAGAGFGIATGAGGRYAARQVVIASGARLRRLGVPGEEEFEGRGVSHCADCDAPMYLNETAVVVGGGDAAMQEALVLAKFCAGVIVVHRGEQLRAKAHLAERAAAEPKIAFRRSTTVDAILGGKMVEKARVRGADGAVGEIPCAGVFVYIGLEPNAAFAPPGIARDAGGHLVTNDALETAVQGAWAVGAVRAGYSGLLRDAFAEGERAAQAVRARLA